MPRHPFPLPCSPLTARLLFIFHGLAQHFTLSVASIPAARRENQDRLPSMELLIGTVLFTVLSFGLCGGPARTVTSELTVKNGGPWGEWGPKEFCRNGHAIGFSIKVLPYQGKWKDDTGLEGVRLHCRDGSTAESLYLVGGSGEWSDVQTCPKGSLMSFSLRVTQPQSRYQDDTAVNNIKFKCPDDYVLTGVGHEWGEFGDWSADCTRGTICGIQTKVEPRQIVDDTGLNDVKLFCCA
ncbi:hypothetical protein lerEdw1_006557 [Lerista edwardsae]|nr:hypothetical protein lerEdw1_006557 [Lerista edwardsae]